MHEFTPWAKTSRLFRDIIITEKIDGTNSAISVQEIDRNIAGDDSVYIAEYDACYAVSAQSRKRVITPGKSTDNYGFARWVHENALELATLLGPGLHFGEWWGAGIQRRYDMPRKAFSLFNTEKHKGLNELVGGIPVQPVPVLWQGPFSEEKVKACLMDLSEYGSEAAPDFMQPEGVCVFHTASRSVFKVTLDNNDAGKWEA